MHHLFAASHFAAGVPRWVPCAECGNRYDADAMRFCSRCGSTVQGKDPEARVPVLANDPRRRRAQMGGAILLFMGLGIFAVWGWGLMMAGFDAEDDIEGFVGLTGDSPIPAGDLHVRALANGTPLPGADVRLRLPSGADYLQGTTDAHGWYNVSLARQAAVTIHVSLGNDSVERRAFVVWPSLEELRIDVLRDEPHASGRVGLEQFSALVVVVLVFIGLASLLMATGGAAALALRLPNLAIAAPIPGLVATTILFLWTILVGAFEVGVLALLALQIAAIAMIASGRGVFRRRRREP